MQRKRAIFSSKVGMMAAAIGSAVGLGNIWKFPYTVGEYGGAAFIIVYLVFVFLIGMPVMLSELALGRAAQSNVVGVFKKLSRNPFWKIIGVLGVATAFVIISFYGVVAGWTLEYLFKAVMDEFSNQSSEEIGEMFAYFVSGNFRPIFWLVIFMLLTGGIVLLGIRNGIERYTKVLMPLFFVFLLVLAVRAITLEGAGAGLSFLFKPDFSKFLFNDGGQFTLEPTLSALGQAFFSLSLGMGTIITYGSYVSKKDKLHTTTLGVSISDTFIALVAGVAIFPAVFAFGLAPNQEEGLVFITLPNVFLQMTGGYFFGIMFFLLLTVAALTSAISLLEVLVTYAIEELKFSRMKATLIFTGLTTFTGLICALSQSNTINFKLFNKNFFGLLVHLGSNILLPLGGLLIIVFAAWFLDTKVLREELSNGGKLKIAYYKLYIFFAKYVVPVGITIIFLSAIGVVG